MHFFSLSLYRVLLSVQGFRVVNYLNRSPVMPPAIEALSVATADLHIGIVQVLMTVSTKQTHIMLFYQDLPANVYDRKRLKSKSLTQKYIMQKIVVVARIMKLNVSKITWNRLYCKQQEKQQYSM